MKSAVLIERKKLAHMEQDIPLPYPGEVIIANLRCGVCRTDRKAYNSGQVDLVMPRVLGHEIAAFVHAQNGVSAYAPG